MAVATATNGRSASDDLLPVLHEEIARLPEKYRLAVVHCDLEGMTQAQAAGQLHWSERTLHKRLAEARARLKRRLARRGLAPDGATLGAVFLREARAAVPAAWSEATIRAARRHSESHSDRRGRLGGSSAIGSGGVQDHVAPEAHIGIGHSVGGRPDRLGGVGRLGLARAGSPEGGDLAHGSGRPGNRRYGRPAAETGLLRHGRHIPGSRSRARPRRQAGGRRRGLRAPLLPNLWSDTTIDPMAARQKGRVAVTDADGRFHFELDKGASDVSLPSGGPVGTRPRSRSPPRDSHRPGSRPGTWSSGARRRCGWSATTYRVRGRVLDSQGRPVAGVVVRLASDLGGQGRGRPRRHAGLGRGG